MANADIGTQVAERVTSVHIPAAIDRDWDDVLRAFDRIFNDISAFQHITINQWMNRNQVTTGPLNDPLMFVSTRPTVSNRVGGLSKSKLTNLQRISGDSYKYPDGMKYFTRKIIWDMEIVDSGMALDLAPVSWAFSACVLRARQYWITGWHTMNFVIFVREIGGGNQPLGFSNEYQVTPRTVFSIVNTAEYASTLEANKYKAAGGIMYWVFNQLTRKYGRLVSAKFDYVQPSDTGGKGGLFTGIDPNSLVDGRPRLRQGNWSVSGRPWALPYQMPRIQIAAPGVLKGRSTTPGYRMRRRAKDARDAKKAAGG